MAITVNDVRLHASVRMTDTTDGGGGMSPDVIVSGQDNNVFPDVTDLDALSGRVNLRKVFGVAASADTDTFLSSHVVLTKVPALAGQTAVIFQHGGYSSTVADVSTAYSVTQWISNTSAFFSGTGGSADVTISGLDPGSIGTASLLVLYSQDDATIFRSALGSPGTNQITLDAPLPGSGPKNGNIYYLRVSGSQTLRFYGASSLAPVAAGSMTLSGASRWVKASPLPESDTAPISPSPSWLLPTAGIRNTRGYVETLRENDTILIHDTAQTAPVTASNGQVINVGRTNLARARVINGNGAEIARFDRGLTPPTGVGCTADLTAGTVTVTDVTGMQMPIHVEHRIEELNAIAQISGSGNIINLRRATGRAFPATAMVSSLMMLGDVRARYTLGFAQLAWTNTWSDTLIGGQPTAEFNQTQSPLVVQNRGAITQRWAVIFTSATAFRVIGEDVGEVATGNTGTNFAPNNPATNSPYFTIPAAGWGTNWQPGNVFRFNTFAAGSPFWELRCIAQGAALGNDSVTAEYRGYINT